MSANNSLSLSPSIAAFHTPDNNFDGDMLTLYNSEFDKREVSADDTVINSKKMMITLTTTSNEIDKKSQQKQLRDQQKSQQKQMKHQFKNR